MRPGAIRTAIAEAASTVTLPDGIRALTCTGYVPDAITEPAFFVAEFTQEFDGAYGRALDTLEFTARVLVGRQDDRAAQALLDSLLDGSGPTSLKAAIESARGAPGEAALGGLCHDYRVTRVQGYRWYEHADTQYIGAELIISVVGEG